MIPDRSWFARTQKRDPEFYSMDNYISCNVEVVISFNAAVVAAKLRATVGEAFDAISDFANVLCVRRFARASLRRSNPDVPGAAHL
jgi:hypothetical protein